MMMMMFRDRYRYIGAANKLRGIFDQCSPAVENILFRAYSMPICACQWRSKYTQTSMKRLRAACNNAYRIIHIPRNVSDRPHQVSHRVAVFYAQLINNLHCFLRFGSSSHLFIRSLQMPDAFYKSLFSSIQCFSMTVTNWYVVALYQCTRLISIVFA